MLLSKEKAHSTVKGLENKGSSIREAAKKKGGGGRETVIVSNIHEDMLVITSIQGSGCCEQGPTRSHMGYLLFAQLKFTVSIRMWQ